MNRRRFVQLAGAASLAATGCRNRTDSVVVYTAHDRQFSEPLFAPFTAATGIRVKARYDTEATKTVGLVNALRNEVRRPRCDVFWNNELLNTLRLQHEGILAPYAPTHAALFPPAFRDPDHHWTGFAARARILLVNTDLVSPEQRPTSIRDLADPRWQGHTALARPLFGTTATHAAALWGAWGADKAEAFFKSLLANQVQVQGGNKQVARAVSSGSAAFGLTDTDDANIEVQAGRPVQVVYPDSGPEEPGTLFIPNTAALIAGSPNPDAGRALLDYLISPEVEETLAAGPAAQIPLNTRSPRSAAPGPTPAELSTFPLTTDPAQAVTDFEAAATWLSAKGF